VNVRVVLIAFFALVSLTLVATKALCRCRHSLDTRGWGLSDFVDHLQDRGVRLHIVPSRADGRWADNIYLTTDPEATWESFQLKNLNVERIDQWRGAVLLHQIGPETDVEGLLEQWHGHGCRIAGFLMFGDVALIERIRWAIPARE
jgi:hypothetical protein